MLQKPKCQEDQEKFISLSLSPSAVSENPGGMSKIVLRGVCLQKLFSGSLTKHGLVMHKSVIDGKDSRTKRFFQMQFLKCV